MKVIDELMMDIMIAEDEVEALEKPLGIARDKVTQLRRDLIFAEEFERYNKMTTDEILGPPRFQYECPFNSGEDHDDGYLVYHNDLLIHVEKHNYMLLIGNFCEEYDCLRDAEAVLAEFSIEEGFTPWIDEQNNDQ